jgi:hypothetical protein
MQARGGSPGEEMLPGVLVSAALVFVANIVACCVLGSYGLVDGAVQFAFIMLILSEIVIASLLVAVVAVLGFRLVRK